MRVHRAAGRAFRKNLGNIEEVKARNGPVIAVGTQGDDVLADLCDDVVLVPPCEEFLAPLLTVVPLNCSLTTSESSWAAMWINRETSPKA